MSTLLLTGGTGFLGSYILKELEHQDFKSKMNIDTIRLLVRDLSKAADIKSSIYNIEAVEGDLMDNNSLLSAVSGVDYVIHTAAKFEIFGKWSIFKKTNVDGTKKLIEGLEPGSTFILTSSSGVYGFNANQGKPFKEEYEPKKPQGNYQKSKKMQEDVAREESIKRGIKFVAIRPVSIVGPGDWVGTYRIMKNIEKKRVVLVRGGRGILPIVHPTDVARAHLLAIQNAKKFNGEAFHVVSVHIPFKDYINAFTKEMGLAPVTRKVPFRILYTIASLLDILPFNHDFTKFSVKYLASNDRLDLTNITEKLGFKPEYDLETIVKESVTWYNSL